MSEQNATLRAATVDQRNAQIVSRLLASAGSCAIVANEDTVRNYVSERLVREGGLGRISSTRFRVPAQRRATRCVLRSTPFRPPRQRLGLQSRAPFGPQRR